MPKKSTTKMFTPTKKYFWGGILVTSLGVFAMLVVFIIFFKTMRQSEQMTAGRSATLTSVASDEWRQKLTPLQYAVLRERATEVPFTGELLDNKVKGTYVTADCGTPVFRSEQKYDSKTGWPSFWAPLDEKAIVLKEDNSEGMKRVEVIDSKCGSHLGHVFDDGPEPTGKRFCINSAALKFIPD